MPTESSRYLSPDEVCAMVPGLTAANLAQRRYLGKEPRFLKPTPKLVLYRKNDVIGWIEGSEHTQTGDRPASP